MNMTPQRNLEEQLSDFEFLFSGRLMDYLNKNYNLRIPTNESYETIAGYIFLHTESIPKEGDVVLIDQFSILIEKVGETRIELIKLVLTPEGSEV